MGPAPLEGAGDVGVVHEAVAHLNPVKALAQLLDLEPLRLRDMRDVLRADGHQHHLLVQHLIVPDVVQQRHRHDRGVAGQEHGRAGNPGQLRVELVDEALDRAAVAVEPVAHHAGGRGAR